MIYNKTIPENYEKIASTTICLHACQKKRNCSVVESIMKKINVNENSTDQITKVYYYYYYGPMFSKVQGPEEDPNKKTCYQRS